jgi:hypothetical protein
MRSMRDIKRDIAQVPVRVGSKADDAMLEHLLRELSASKEGPAVRRMRTGLRVLRLMACAASIAIAASAATWLLYGGRAPQNHQPASDASATSTSRIALLTEISLERAFRHGGIPAVESQFQKALAGPAGKHAIPSIDELLAELAGTGKDTGGTRS